MSTTTGQAPLLVSPKQVQELLKNEQVALLDASWFMPNSSRNGKAEFQEKRLPGAQFLDLDEVASPHELGLKHMMPEPHVFAEACGECAMSIYSKIPYPSILLGRYGISPSSHVVIYDTHGIFSSPRALFMFRAFGHEKSSIINGGLPRWVDEGLALEKSRPQQPRAASYAERQLNKQLIRGQDFTTESMEWPILIHQQIMDKWFLIRRLTPPRTLLSKSCWMLDRKKGRLLSGVSGLLVLTWSLGRYSGAAPEPRPGLSSGHIPHSFSLSFKTFLQKQTSKVDGSEYTTFLSQDALRRVLESAVGLEQAQAIIDGKRPVITSCGSGMTAGVLWLGLRLLGVKNIALYDEVCSLVNFPIENKL
jgi:thiosulfate/3-mercaptopyruvate sulfurtransferase